MALFNNMRAWRCSPWNKPAVMNAVIIQADFTGCAGQRQVCPGNKLCRFGDTLFGKLTDKIDLEHCHDIAKNEVIVLAVLCGLIALFGIMPSVAMDFITPFSAGINLI